MVYIKRFKELSKDDINLVGGKGANLGEMFSAGFPVPDGFVLTADAYRDFIAKTGIATKIEEKLKGLDIEDTDKLQETAKEIQALILKEPLPAHMKDELIESYSDLNISPELVDVKNAAAQGLIQAGRDLPFVAVRSSATLEDIEGASFAGQMATFLNIKGNVALAQALQKCWASLFTARAIYYRERNNFSHMKVAIAVIIQKMINSEKAGVMFSVNPATNNENEIVIEGAWGLGEAVVSGAVNPDEYIIDKETGE